jgi:hypothetical protein
MLLFRKYQIWRSSQRLIWKKMQESLTFLEDAMKQGRFATLKSLAEAVGYSERTLARVKSGEVPLSRFMREAIERVLALRSDTSAILCEPPAVYGAKNGGDSASEALISMIQGLPQTPDAFREAAWRATEQAWERFAELYRPRR